MPKEIESSSHPSGLGQPMKESQSPKTDVTEPTLYENLAESAMVRFARRVNSLYKIHEVRVLLAKTQNHQPPEPNDLVAEYIKEREQIQNRALSRRARRHSK